MTKQKRMFRQLDYSIDWMFQYCIYFCQSNGSFCFHSVEWNIPSQAWEGVAKNKLIPNHRILNSPCLTQKIAQYLIKEVVLILMCNFWKFFIHFIYPVSIVGSWTSWKQWCFHLVLLWALAYVSYENYMLNTIYVMR